MAYFSVVQRKVLTPNDLATLADVEKRLLRFQDHYGRIARPFRWHFPRQDLHHLLSKLSPRKTAAVAA